MKVLFCADATPIKACQLKLEMTKEMKSNNIWHALSLMWKTAATRCDVFIDAYTSKKGLSTKFVIIKFHGMNQAFSSSGGIREARKLVHVVDHGRGGDDCKHIRPKSVGHIWV